MPYWVYVGPQQRAFHTESSAVAFALSARTAWQMAGMPLPETKVYYGQDCVFYVGHGQPNPETTASR